MGRPSKRMRQVKKMTAERQEMMASYAKSAEVKFQSVEDSLHASDAQGPLCVPVHTTVNAGTQGDDFFNLLQDAECRDDDGDCDDFQGCFESSLDEEDEDVPFETVHAGRAPGRAGQLVLMFPKYHCEFNFIENLWGRMKVHLRRNCKYDFEALHLAIPEAVASVPVTVIRRYAQRCDRFMDAYRPKDGGLLLTPEP